MAYFVGKIMVEERNMRSAHIRVSPIYSNIPTVAEASYLAQLAITKKHDDELIVIVPSRNDNLDPKVMEALDKIYEERGDKHV